MDDLVKRLRDINMNYELARGVHFDIRKAADRIEADAKRFAELALDALAAETQAEEAYQAQLKAEARVAELEEALRGLDKAASEVARYGAQTGPQWSKLTIASLKARAALEGEQK